MNPTNINTELPQVAGATHSVPEQAEASYSTYVSNNIEYARKKNGQVVRMTPKPLSKKERNRLRKATT